jgi:hypothetical protein
MADKKCTQSIHMLTGVHTAVGHEVSSGSDAAYISHSVKCSGDNLFSTPGDNVTTDMATRCTYT